MRSWRLMGRLSSAALLAGSFAGCGGVSAPTVQAPSQAMSRSVARSPQPSSQAAPACYPDWEYRDLTQVLRTPAPSPSVTITADLGNGPRLTTASLPIWFGQSSAPSRPAAGLLQGWQLGASHATRGSAEVQLVMTAGDGPVSFGQPELELVYAAPRPTPAQAGLLRQTAIPTAGPLTWLVPIPGGTPQTSVTSAVAALVKQVAEAGPAGVPMAVAELSSAPGAPGWQTYAGPFNPASLLNPGSPCTAGTGWVLAMKDRLIVPRRAAFASIANGIRFGFAPHAVVLESNHAGYATVEWFELPAVSVPPLPAGSMATPR
ncbi:MAG: hypothetical protein K6U87_12450 [Firmicutes bacterium]|nr:hypothetical protein [Bacillota bacterium]